MKIACLGWGSLIWRPEGLLIQRQWFLDGPMLPIEFARQSNDGRLTLVIKKDAMLVRTLWANMATTDIELAKTSLQIREGISDNRREQWIASVTAKEKTTDSIKQLIQNWAINLDIDAVIWTNLPPKFNDTVDVSPTLIQATQYLCTLDINSRNNAANYIRRAPKQIDTEYRREFEKLWGWTFIETEL